jgi:hypothetical protein
VQYRTLGAAAALVAAMACKSAPARTSSGDLTGAPTARGAVERFLAAVRAQDLQAMSVVWGTKDGPARDALPRDLMEKREVIMTQCLAHDSASFIDETPSLDGARQVRFILYRGPVTRTTSFTAESSPQSRWYVREIDLRNVHSCTVEAGQQIK